MQQKNQERISEKFRHLCRPLNFSLYLAFITGIVIGLTYNFELPVIAIAGFLVIYLLENFRRPVGVSYISEIIDDSIMATVLSTDSQISAVTASIIAWLSVSRRQDRNRIRYYYSFCITASAFIPDETA